MGITSCSSTWIIVVLISQNWAKLQSPKYSKIITKSFERIDENLEKGANILIHCVGGLGRTGLVSACYLIHQGMSAQDAIDEVRSVRSKRAIESESQELFVYKYKKMQTPMN